MPPVFWYMLWPVLGALGVTLLLVAQPIGAPRPSLWEWLARQDVAARAAERARRVDPAPPVVPWPAMDRVLGPLLADAAAQLAHLQARFGAGDPARLAQIRLVRPGTTATGWLGKKLALAALGGVVPALAGVLFRVFDVPDLFVGQMPWWVWALVGMAGYLSPDAAVNQELGERRHRLRAALPALLQTLVIGSSAGLSLQACLRLVAREGSGPLVEAIRTMLRDLDAGRYRSTGEALPALAGAASIPEVDRVVQRLVGNTAAGAGFQLAVRELALGLQAEDRVALKADGQVRQLKMLAVAAGVLLLPILIVFFFPLIQFVRGV